MNCPYDTMQVTVPKQHAQESVGLRKSKRKFGWARTDFVDFAGQ
jgi:hypothetical protein